LGCLTWSPARIDEQPVHDLSAALDDGPDLVAVDRSVVDVELPR
jgi:hypothetical protein